MKANQTKLQGFTLVELTIVMVIVALLLGGLLVPLSAQQDARQLAETEKQLAETRDALVGYAQINGFLPFPAKSWDDGNERSPANCSDATQPLTGFIPWTALGVKGTDPFGRLIRYRVSCNFTKINAAITAATLGEITISKHGTDNANFITNKNDVAFVILSGGKNGFYGVMPTPPSGVTMPSGANNDDEKINENGRSVTAPVPSTFMYVSRTATPDTTPTLGGFDDTVIWMPRTLLINRLVAAGKI